MAVYSVAILGLVSSCGGGGGGGSSGGGSSGGVDPNGPAGEISISVSGLNRSTTYYWKVSAGDGVNTVESTTRSFTTMP